MPSVSLQESQGKIGRDETAWDFGAADPAALGMAPVFAAAVAVFLIDVAVVGSEAGGVLYLAPVAWVALWSRRNESSSVIGVAVLSSALAAVGLFASFSGLGWWQVVDRVIVVLVIWVTALLSLMRKRVEEEVRTLEGLLPICSFCKKIRDDEGSWKPIEVYVADHSRAAFTHGLCPDCCTRHYPDLFTTQATGTGA
ncbi:hypothetical protein [Candidatus Nitrospira bockiana]